MASCERCWGEARQRAMWQGGSVSEHYYVVMKEREDANNVCTPQERAGQFWDESEQRDTRLPRGEDSQNG